MNPHLLAGATCAGFLLVASTANAQTIPLNGPAVAQAGGVLVTAGNAANAVTSVPNGGTAVVGAAAPYTKPAVGAEAFGTRGLSSGIKQTGANMQTAGETVTPSGATMQAPESIKSAERVVAAVPSKATIAPGTLSGTPSGAVGGALISSGQTASLGGNAHEVVARPLVKTVPGLLPFTSSVTNNFRAIGSGGKQTGVAIQQNGLGVNPQAGATAAAQAAVKAPASVTSAIGKMGH